MNLRRQVLYAWNATPAEIVDYDKEAKDATLLASAKGAVSSLLPRLAKSTRVSLEPVPFRRAGEEKCLGAEVFRGMKHYSLVKLCDWAKNLLYANEMVEQEYSHTLILLYSLM